MERYGNNYSLTPEFENERANLINHAFYNFERKQLPPKQLEFILKKIAYYSDTVVEKAMSKIIDDPEIKNFPKVAELSKICQSIKDSGIKEARRIVPCDMCLGLGYLDAIGTMGKSTFQTVVRCSCPNADNSFPFINFGQKYEKHVDNKYVGDVVYQPVKKDYAYSGREVSSEAISEYSASFKKYLHALDVKSATTTLAIIGLATMYQELSIGI